MAQEAKESSAVIKHAFEIARTLGIQYFIVEADELSDRALIEEAREAESVIWVTRDTSELEASLRSGDQLLEVQSTALRRLDQINLAVCWSVLRNHIQINDRVVCLSGAAGSNRLDTLLLCVPGRDYPWLKRVRGALVEGLLLSKEFGRVLEIALRFGLEGREGKPIGTIFLIGEPEELEPFLRPLILNPCKGHPRRLRSVHNPDFVETLRELSALDGAFLISTKGVVEASAVYIDASMKKSSRLSPGRGARHAAAGAITSLTQSVAIALSESSRTVSVYQGGKRIIELDFSLGAEVARSARQS